MSAARLQAWVVKDGLVDQEYHSTFARLQAAEETVRCPAARALLATSSFAPPGLNPPEPLSSPACWLLGGALSLACGCVHACTSMHVIPYSPACKVLMLAGFWVGDGGREREACQDGLG